MNKETKIFLLELARSTIAKKLGIQEKTEYGANFDSPELIESKGTFVTLTMNGNLRGCIGQILPDEPIVETIKQNAISAAFKDPRFPAIDTDEFNKINIEISILSVPKEIKYSSTEQLLDLIHQDEYGLIICKGYKSATFLPQVWEDLPSKEEFLSHLCMKAGLQADEWTKGSLEVLYYTVEHFNEES